MISNAKEFILSIDDYYADAVEHGYDIRADEQTWLIWCEQYAEQYKSILHNVQLMIESGHPDDKILNYIKHFINDTSRSD